jgi:ATP-dependent DNA helicase RecQ
MNSSEILKYYWKHDSFRPQQEEIINHLYEGKDVLAILPTGGGKSLCYQLPALMKPGLCLVISPLIALMKDQVAQLEAMGIPALFINSGQTKQEVKHILQQATHKDYKLLYVSPERLQTSLFKDYLPALEINLLAVDEAHCISQWGYDFRPAYLQIAELRKELFNVPCIALTASATQKVQQDILEKLEITDAKVVKQSFARNNLSYSVLHPESKMHKLVDVLKKVNGSAIVYCSNRKRTKELADLLRSNNITADHYHAGLELSIRNQKQDDWMNDNSRVIVSTNAFGMGINKPDVRVVIHYDVPDSLESYYQEAGRAGRDGKLSFAVLLYNEDDIKHLNALPDQRYPTIEEIKKIYQSLADYLQVPVGIGEGEYYDFDISTFTKNFKLNTLQVINALQVLQTQGFINFNENIFRPSHIQFTTDAEQMNEFEKLYPDLDVVIKTLLRTYPGIFDASTTVYEKQLSRLSRLPVEELTTKLEALHKYRVIDYKPQQENPQVYFITNRAPANYLNINEKIYAERKLIYSERVQQMISYLKDTKSCRSQFIADYFGENIADKCGVCDHCLAEKQQHFPAEEFNSITEKIKKQLSIHPATPENLLISIKVPKVKFWKVINFLLDENIIVKGENELLKLP